MRWGSGTLSSGPAKSSLGRVLHAGRFEFRFSDDSLESVGVAGKRRGFGHDLRETGCGLRVIAPSVDSRSFLPDSG